MESYLCIYRKNAGEARDRELVAGLGSPTVEDTLMHEDWARLGPQGIPWENPNIPSIHS